MKQFITLLFATFMIFNLSAQINTSYYYNGSSVPVTLSNRIICIKFVPQLSNATKQNMITASQGTLVNNNWDSISDYVQIQSKLTTTTTTVYPCGDPNVARGTAEPKHPVTNVTAPCQGCPDCTPYTVSTTTNNFEDVINYFLQSTNITSAAPAATNFEAIVGTAEDFYIKINSSYTISNFNSLLAANNVTATNVSAQLGNNVYKITLARSVSRYCFDKAILFYQSGMCDFSTPNFYQFGNIATSNDPLFPQQWSLQNTGQVGGTSGADIRVVPAWDLSKGAGIKVAVVDQGVQLDHEDLQANLLSGYDALLQGTSGGTLNASDPHGTGCAGIIGAVGDNVKGLSGVAPECKIIPIRAYIPGMGTSTNEELARAINWAWQNGADVISNSWKWPYKNDLMDNAIHDAITLGRGGKGAIVVFGTGNENIGTIAYPSSLSDVIAVGAMSMCNTRKSFISCDGENRWGSNYGEGLDMMAPGVKIVTTAPGGGYVTDFNGTSSACPHVAGVAALVLSANPNLTNQEVRRILRYSCNKTGPYCYSWTSAHPDGAWSNEMGYGRINAYNAVQLALRSTSYSTPVYNVPQQNNTLVSGGNFQLVVVNPGCAALSSAVYFVQRYEVTSNITYPATTNPLIICSSNGWSAANPNDGKNYATALNVTNTSASLKTWVYAGFNSIGQFLGWFPSAPADIKFNYSVIGANAAITYQTLRTANTDSSKSKNMDFEFDKPGPTNDIQIDISKENDKLFIYPNPTTNLIYLSNNFSQNAEINKIDLLDITGKTIRSIPVHSKGLSVTPIDISKLSNGVYLLKVYTAGKVVTQKVIKQ